MTPTSMSGTFGSIHQLMITVGVVLGYIFGGWGILLSPADYWWQVAMITPAIPMIAQFIIFKFFYKWETPIHLYINN